MLCAISMFHIFAISYKKFSFFADVSYIGCDIYNLNEDQKLRRSLTYLLCFLHALLRQKDNDYDFSGHIPTRFIIMMISSSIFFSFLFVCVALQVVIFFSSLVFMPPSLAHLLFFFLLLHTHAHTHTHTMRLYAFLGSQQVAFEIKNT